MREFQLKEVYDPHKRECWSCKTINDHEAAITPWVLCPHCGSQDTRRIVPPPQPYRPQPGDDVWVRAKVVEAFTEVDDEFIITIRDGLGREWHTSAPLTAIRPLHAGQEAQR